MVGHEIQNVAHAVRAQGRYELLEVFACTDFRVERVVIHHVVTVHAARPRAEVGRAVHVTDSERREIRNQLRRLAEREARVELQPIGCARNHGASTIGPAGRRSYGRRFAWRSGGYGVGYCRFKRCRGGGERRLVVRSRSLRLQHSHAPAATSRSRARARCVSRRRGCWDAWRR